MAGGNIIKTIARIVYRADEQLVKAHPSPADAYVNYDGQVWAVSKNGDHYDLDLSRPATRKFYPLN